MNNGSARDSFTKIIQPPLKLIFSKVLAGIFLAGFIAGCGSLAASSPTRLAPTLSADCAPGSYVNEIISGGEPRQYRLYIPQSYSSEKPAALVFGFHGNNGLAQHFESYSGFSARAENAGFIVVYPQGSGERPTWETSEGSKDVQFVGDLIGRLEAQCKIDATRIYATGHSLGGGMANRLACDLSEQIAAIGPVSGAYQDSELCSPSRPVPVVSIHGTRDSVVFYNGIGSGDGLPPAGYLMIGVPIPQWASAWAQRNDCNPKAEIFFRKDAVSGQQWGNCRGGADVILYTIREGEHGWPAPTLDFDAAHVIWDFFARHPLVPGASD